MEYYIGPPKESHYYPAYTPPEKEDLSKAIKKADFPSLVSLDIKSFYELRQDYKTASQLALKIPIRPVTVDTSSEPLRMKPRTLGKFIAKRLTIELRSLVISDVITPLTFLFDSDKLYLFILLQAKKSNELLFSVADTFPKHKNIEVFYKDRDIYLLNKKVNEVVKWVFENWGVELKEEELKGKQILRLERTFSTRPCINFRSLKK